MRPALRSLILIAVLAPAIVRADPGFDLAIAVFGDAEGGASLDIDASLAPATWLTLSAGAGTSDAAFGTTEVGGEALRASADLHSQRFGLAPYFRGWKDEADFTVETTGARVYFMSGGFLGTLIAESQDLSVGFTSLVLGRPVARRASFESLGLGAGLSFYGNSWAGYVEGLFYDFDERFDDVVALSRSPGIDRFPRIQALVGSILTLTQGALDYELVAGIERIFEHSSLRLDCVGVEDAVDGTRAGSVSGTWRRSLSVHVDVAATIGVTDSETLDSLAYGGLTLLLHR
jgi:hypothetical protein